MTTVVIVSAATAWKIAAVVLGLFVLGAVVVVWRAIR